MGFIIGFGTNVNFGQVSSDFEQLEGLKTLSTWAVNFAICNGVLPKKL